MTQQLLDVLGRVAGQHEQGPATGLRGALLQAEGEQAGVAQ
jgi:hypothetical protein